MTLPFDRSPIDTSEKVAVFIAAMQRKEYSKAKDALKLFRNEEGITVSDSKWVDAIKQIILTKLSIDQQLFGKTGRRPSPGPKGPNPGRKPPGRSPSPKGKGIFGMK